MSNKLSDIENGIKEKINSLIQELYAKSKLEIETDIISEILIKQIENENQLIKECKFKKNYLVNNSIQIDKKEVKKIQLQIKDAKDMNKKLIDEEVFLKNTYKGLLPNYKL